MSETNDQIGPTLYERDIEGWTWDFDRCPCDAQFIEWMGRYDPGHAIFHMGTGLHHKVGLACSEKGIPCLGVTVSLEEYRTAPTGRFYQCYLANIYTLHRDLLPTFSTMTLFHLGEHVDDFGDIDYPSVAKLITRVRRDGRVLFYSGSAAWDRARKFMQWAVEHEHLAYDSTYQQLVVMVKR